MFRGTTYVASKGKPQKKKSGKIFNFFYPFFKPIIQITVRCKISPQQLLAPADRKEGDKTHQREANTTHGSEPGLNDLIFFQISQRNLNLLSE